MALTIIDQEYATGEEGFAAMCADMEAAYAWDETTLDEENGTAAFRKYLDGTRNGYIEISLTQTSGVPTGAVSIFTGASTYDGEFSSGGNYSMKYAKWVIAEDYFVLAGGAVAMPTTNQYINMIGLFPCTNIETGKNSICAVCGSASTYTMMSETMTSSGNYIVGGSNRTGMAIDVVLPVCSRFAKEIADNIWLLEQTTEGYVNTAGYRNFRGDERYRVMNFLLPVN